MGCFDLTGKIHKELELIFINLLVGNKLVEIRPFLNRSMQKNAGKQLPPIAFRRFLLNWDNMRHLFVFR